jgi:hypothetical protein
MSSISRSRAQSPGISLDEDDAAIVKGMLARGDRQHDIAAWFGVNAGRVAEISTGQAFQEVAAAKKELLPPPGPYLPGRHVDTLIKSIVDARKALDEAEKLIRGLR